jgi:hypothetical protein
MQPRPPIGIGQRAVQRLHQTREPGQLPQHPHPRRRTVESATRPFCEGSLPGQGPWSVTRHERLRYGLSHRRASCCAAWLGTMEAADDWIVAIVAVLALLISVAAFLYSRRATIAAERAVRWRFAAEPQVFFANTQPQKRASDAMTQMVNEGDGTAYYFVVALHQGPQVIGGPLLNGATVHSNDWVRLSPSTARYGEHQERRCAASHDALPTTSGASCSPTNVGQRAQAREDIRARL